ncbi:GDP-mannose 4,6-dehydratase [Candidatus Berkelbacteria bacterium]|nr:GDP-mannose 4,6-dehydratase [Candidatus Berkelbacteria bacterium]
MTPKKHQVALLSGVTGQDGSYLAEFLLDKNYEVHGIIRRSSSFNTGRIDHIYQDPHERGKRLFLHYGDLTDSSVINQLIKTIKPDEIYHLGSQSHVKVSFEMPEYTGDVTGIGTTRILEAIRGAGFPIKFYNAGSSEMFGLALPPQNEHTPFHPRSPYAAAKVYSHHITQNYREAYGIFAVSGILFNHESERRGETFVTRKITRGIAKIIAGEMDKIYLGNLDAKRDWGYAPEYITAMYKMLQLKKPDDFVIGTGQSHSVREFLQEAFGLLGLDYKQYVEIDKRYLRPSDVPDLVADTKKAQQAFGWKPKITFKELVKIMVEADLTDTLGKDWQTTVTQFARDHRK